MTTFTMPGDDLDAVVERLAVSAPMVPPVQAHVRDDDVGACARHVGGLLLVEHVGAGEHVKLVRLADHVHLELVTHARFLEVLAERAVDEADGGGSSARR